MRDLLAWIKAGSWDWAKVGVVLYVLGILITSIYFLRFSILSLDLLRPQSIIVGLYFVFLFLILPAAFLLLLRPLQSMPWLVLLLFIVLLAVKEVILRLLIEVPPIPWIVLLVIMQSGLFVRLADNRALRFEIVAKDTLAAIALICLLFTFATIIYGSIPGYLGGGRPVAVHVFTEIGELPSNRFMRTRNMPQINRSLPSFRLNLLYESEDYLYFIAETSGRMEGYSIMRLKRDEVLRMDYITPVWFSLGGDQ